MSISSMTGVTSTSLLQHTPKLAAGAPSKTSAASTPAQQLAAGDHHHRPAINGAASTQGAGQGHPAAARAQGSAGLNTLA